MLPNAEKTGDPLNAQISTHARMQVAALGCQLQIILLALHCAQTCSIVKANTCSTEHMVDLTGLLACGRVFGGGEFGEGKFGGRVADVYLCLHCGNSGSWGAACHLISLSLPSPILNQPV